MPPQLTHGGYSEDQGGAGDEDHWENPTVGGEVNASRAGLHHDQEGQKPSWSVANESAFEVEEGSGSPAYRRDLDLAPGQDDETVPLPPSPEHHVSALHEGSGEEWNSMQNRLLGMHADMAQGFGGENPYSVIEDENFDSAKIFKALDARSKSDRITIPEGRIHDCLTFAIHPHNNKLLWWDLYCLLLVIYSAFREPYAAAFLPNTGYSALEYIIDISFYVDIVVNFHTGFDDAVMIVMEKREIARRYMRGWFLADLMTTINWDGLIRFLTTFCWSVSVTNPCGSKKPLDSPLVKLLRVGKVARLVRASRLIDNLTEKWTIDSSFISAGKFFLYNALCAHLLACFFFMIPTLFSCDENHKSSLPYMRAAYGPKSPACDLPCDTTPCADPDPLEDPHCFMGRSHVSTCLQGSWIQVYGLDQMDSYMRQYIDALYWSITTMTTIGYGDRMPMHEGSHEILFVLFSEVFGLAFFAILMTEINSVNDALGLKLKGSNKIKNDMVTFMKYKKFNEELIESMVRFLNFRGSTVSGSDFDPDGAEWKCLSPALRRQIQLKLYLPIFQNVRFFGYNEEDVEGVVVMEKIFTDLDPEGDGALGRDDVSKMMKDMSIELTAIEFDQCFHEMDSTDSGEVTYYEFQLWWNTQKYGLPKISQAPLAFLEALAMCCTTQACTMGEEIVEDGHYGEDFIILLAGEATVYKYPDEATKQHEAMVARKKWVLVKDVAQGADATPLGKLAGLGGSLGKAGLAQMADPKAAAIATAKLTKEAALLPAIAAKNIGLAALSVFQQKQKDLKKAQDKPERELSSTDPVAAVGLSAVLPDLVYHETRLKTEHWVVRATTYVDTVRVKRADLLRCLDDAWPALPNAGALLGPTKCGREQMEFICSYLYGSQSATKTRAKNNWKNAAALASTGAGRPLGVLGLGRAGKSVAQDEAIAAIEAQLRAEGFGPAPDAPQKRPRLTEADVDDLRGLMHDKINNLQGGLDSKLEEVARMLGVRL